MTLMTQKVNISVLNLPTCSQVCVHGTCGTPNTCVCESGWSGNSCDTG